MKNEDLMNIVGQLNTINNYKKALYFASGLIIAGGVTCYFLYERNRQAEENTLRLLRENTNLKDKLNNQEATIKTVYMVMDDINRDHLQMFNAISKLTKGIDDLAKSQR